MRQAQQAGGQGMGLTGTGRGQRHAHSSAWLAWMLLRWRSCWRSPEWCPARSHIWPKEASTSPACGCSQPSRWRPLLDPSADIVR